MDIFLIIVYYLFGLNGLINEKMRVSFNLGSGELANIQTKPLKSEEGKCFMFQSKGHKNNNLVHPA